jgi:hypothetical protein
MGGLSSEAPQRQKELTMRTIAVFVAIAALMAGCHHAAPAQRIATPPRIEHAAKATAASSPVTFPGDCSTANGCLLYWQGPNNTLAAVHLDQALKIEPAAPGDGFNGYKLALANGNPPQYPGIFAAVSGLAINLTCANLQALPQFVTLTACPGPVTLSSTNATQNGQIEIDLMPGTAASPAMLHVGGPNTPGAVSCAGTCVVDQNPYPAIGAYPVAVANFAGTKWTALWSAWTTQPGVLILVPSGN